MSGSTTSAGSAIPGNPDPAGNPRGASPSGRVPPQNPAAPLRTRTPPPLAWLFAPSPALVIFALRNCAAALLALGIAFWMEMDDPTWAAMTVWIVASTSRGETQSKAKWRLVGTAMGMIAAITFVALTPQEPWLFFPMLALWVGLCSGFATFVTNFRAYSLVLAGYTCTIITMGAFQNPTSVFFIGMSRVTYITLGILCEAFMGLIFTTSQERHAREQIRQKLKSALILVTGTLCSILGEERGALNAARRQFGTILTINNQIEFAEAELGPHGHEGDHARAALASVSALLSRGFGMATRLELLDHTHPAFTETADSILLFLKDFPRRLENNDAVPDLLAELQRLRDICLLYAAPHRRTDIQTGNEPIVGTDPFDLSRDGEENESHLDERVLFVSLGELLGEMEIAIKEYEASLHAIRGDHFHFQQFTHRDGRVAFHNGLRTACAVLIAGYIYEVTAWNSGPMLITFASVTSGLFAYAENPTAAVWEFFKGAVGAVFVAGILEFALLPRVTTFEGLALLLGPAMMIGALSRAVSVFAAAAFGLMMPAMLGLGNQSFENEITFYNTNMGLVCGVLVSMAVFKTVLPFSGAEERFRLRRHMLSELRDLASSSRTPIMSAWVGRNTDRFARLIRHAGPTPAPLIEACILGTLATLTLGLNVIRLRTLLDREYLPESARRPIRLVLRYIEQSTRRHDKAARVASAAVRRLRVLDEQERDLLTRLELTRAITYLIVVDHTLRTNVDFLDANKRFTGEHSGAGRRQAAMAMDLPPP